MIVDIHAAWLTLQKLQSHVQCKTRKPSSGLVVRGPSFLVNLKIACIIVHISCIYNYTSYFFQIRKLEFLMADVLHKKCDHVITMGGLQSNHARATAVISRQLGLQPHLLLRTTDMVNDN